MLLGGALVVAACATNDYPELRADLPPETTLSGITTSTTIGVDTDLTPSTTAFAASSSNAALEGLPVAEDDWRDVTANLVGLESSCGNVSFLSTHPETGDVIVNVSTQGLYSLTESAEEWARIGTGGATINHRTQGINYDPSEPDRFWVSGAYGNGVYRTDDGGSSFRQLGSVSHVDHVAVDRDDPDRQTMLAGIHEATSLMLSRNGGETWQDIAEALPQTVGFTSAPLIVGDAFFVGTYRGPDAGIYRSDDEGESWEAVYEGGVLGAPVVTDDYIAWNLEGSNGGLAVSLDDGSSFLRSGATPGGTSATLVELGEDRLATVGRNGVAITSDLGDTWSFVGEPLEFEPRGLAYSPVRSAFYAWTFTCNVDDDGNPVLAESIMELAVEDAT